MKINAHNLKGEKAGTIELPERIFGVKWNPILVKQVFNGEQANKRIPWAHTKGRGEIRGGGRKPWRQKGLGRSRHGSSRSPIWIGGGVAHGPLKTRDYSVKINKKMSRGALVSILSRKLKDKEIIMVDQFVLDVPKTKTAFTVFKNLRDTASIYNVGIKGGKTLVSVPKNDSVFRSIRNLPYVDRIEPRNLNISVLLSCKYILFDKLSIKELENTLK
jgi:large subunit ribosomal protein L4